MLQFYLQASVAYTVSDLLASNFQLIYQGLQLLLLSPPNAHLWATASGYLKIKTKAEWQIKAKKRKTQK